IYIRSKLITPVECKSPPAVVSITLERPCVVNAQRPDRQIKSKSNPGIGSDVVEAKRPRLAIDETRAIKDCAGGFFDKWESKFPGCARQGIATDWFAELIFRPDFTEWKPAEVVSAAEIKPLINGHIQNSPGNRGRRWTWWWNR